MIPREIVKKLRKIEIHTARLANDQLAGSYHSVFKGRGMAFSEVRQYQPGDDVRFIDWNVSARMRDTYVKVFTEEREMTVMLLVDLSASGLFGTVSQPKQETAAEVAALLAFSVEMQVAVIAAIGLSMLWNFGLNRAFSFAGATDGPLLRQLFDFVSACALGAVVNYFVTLLAVSWLDHPQLAATVGVLAATGFNFTASRLYVFKRRHVRKSK